MNQGSGSAWGLYDFENRARLPSAMRSVAPEKILSPDPQERTVRRNMLTFDYSRGLGYGAVVRLIKMIIALLVSLSVGAFFHSS